MSLADRKKEFLAVRTARGLAARKLFEERAPNALRDTVLAALADEVEKERTLDEEARRMMEAARQEIASGKVDGQELFRRVRRKLAEQRGVGSLGNSNCELRIANLTGPQIRNSKFEIRNLSSHDPRKENLRTGGAAREAS